MGNQITLQFYCEAGRKAVERQHLPVVFLAPVQRLAFVGVMMKNFFVVGGLRTSRFPAVACPVYCTAFLIVPLGSRATLPLIEHGVWSQTSHSVSVTLCNTETFSCYEDPF